MGIQGENSLYWATGIDTSGLASGTRKAKGYLSDLTGRAEKEAAEMDRIFKRLGTAIGAYLSFSAGKEFISDIVRVRGEFQQLDVALQTMLGSKQKANQMMNDIIEMSIKTPFTLMDVAANTKQLMAMGIASEKVMDTIKSLGDVSAGLAVPLQRIAINYGQVATLGKLQTREIRDFAMAGVPLVEELADMLGKSKAEIQDMVTAGQIGFPEVEQAFKNMSSEGGKFANLMEKQMGTVTGRISNLKDAFDRMLNAIGEANEGTIVDVIGLLKTAVENYEEIIDVVKVVAATYGTYRAVLLAVTIAEKARALAPLVQTYVQLSRAIGLAATNQFVFNRATLLNPYVAAAGAIAALVGALVLFKKETVSATDVQKSFQSSLKGMKDLTEFSSMVSEYEYLSKNVKLSNKEQKRYNSLIAEIIKLHPEATKTTDEYGKAIELNTERLKNAVDEQRQNMTDILTANLNLAKKTLRQLEIEFKQAQEKTQKTYVKKGGVTPGAGTYYNTKDRIVQNSDEVIAENAKLVEKTGEEIEKVKKNITEYQNMLVLLTGSKSDFIKAYKDLFVDLDGLTGDELSNLKKQLENLMVVDAKGKFKEEILNQIKEIEKALENLNEKDGFDIEGYEKALKEKKKAYDVYENEVLQLGKKAADERNKILLQEGKNWEEFLKTQLLQFAGNQVAIGAIAKAAASEMALGKLPDMVGLISKGTETIDLNDLLDIDTKTLKGIDEWNKKWKETVSQIENATQEEDIRKMVNGIYDASFAMQDLAHFASNFNDELAQSLSDIAEVGQGVGNIIGGYYSGNYSQMASGVVSIAQVIYDMYDNSAEKQQVIVDKANALLDILKLQSRELEKQLNYYNEQGRYNTLIDTIQAQIMQLNNLANGIAIEFQKGSDTITRYITGGVDELNSKLGDYYTNKYLELGYDITNLDEITDILNQYDELVEQRKNLIADIVGSTQEQLVQSIIDGLEEGLSATEAFANTFEDSMRQAMINAFKTTYLMPVMNHLVNDIYDLITNTKQGTSNEDYQSAIQEGIDALKEQYKDDIAFIESGYGLYSDILNDLGLGFSDTDSSSSLSGSIQKNLTEETGSLLAGLFNVMSIDVRNIYTFIVENASSQAARMQENINILNAIEVNTRETASNTNRLEKIESVLVEIRDNTEVSNNSTNR